jgi:hypothetical protein
MKLFLVLGLILATACFLLAQTPSNTSSTPPGSTSASTTTAAAELKGGKVAVPPEKARPVNIPKLSVPVTIDGKIDEEAWRTAAVFKDFYQTGPGYNTAPSRPTEVYMMYDERNLYVAFKCWDERDKIRSSVAKRDNVYGEDNVRMWLDTYDDQRRAYVIGFNPLGIQQDGIYTEGQGADFSVDVVMESKGVIEDWGWSVEVKIPFKSLRYSAGKGKNWGFNVARNIDRFNDEFDQWYPDDRDVSGFLVKFGKITGLDDIKYERTLEIVPSITLSQTSERVPALEFSSGRFVNKPVKQDIGVNLKYTISPNITLDAAINPDFAEIEADAPVISANQRFPIFFEEKRPFFLEGKEIFQSPLQPFYSRTIVDPDFAAKLTGKIGKNSFGLLVASDKAPGNFSEDERTRNEQCLARQERQRELGQRIENCPNDQFIDKNALFGVLRLKRDVGKSNNIGFFGTARVFPKNRNFVGGFDGVYKPSGSMVINFQALGTHSLKNFYDPATDRVRYRNGNGLGYLVNADFSKDRYGWFAEIFGRTKDYRADSGFTRRTNTNQAFFAFRESTKSNPKGKFIRLNFNQFVRYTFDWAGRTQYALAGGNVNAQLQGNLFLYFEAGDQLEHIYEEEFGPKRNLLNPNSVGAFTGAPERTAQQPYFSFNINKVISKQLNFYGFIGSIWGSFDYDFGAGNKFQRVSPAYLAFLSDNRPECSPQLPEGTDCKEIPPLDPGPGKQFDVQAGFEYKPINPLRISLDYTHSQLRRNDTGKLAFETNIFTLRSTYQFSRFTFIRARWDYDTLSSNAKGQMLFGWNPNPGTAFYVGYNDDFNYRGYNPFSQVFEPGFARNGRTFFIRASYLFRKSF